ncbi:MAG TPA: family 43 glycosylhydrolase [Opitutus sp.]|nr:family 43 glycosylhydrolase [Opitutus sp.]
MNHPARRFLAAVLLALLPCRPSFATNPLITDQFTADPTARVFDGRVYVYPSHDIIATPGKGRPGWFCMEDYHVFSSENLTDWQDHGVIVSQNAVDWVKPDSYSMWAPDCVAKDGRYYFYFPALARVGRGFGIGVAIGDSPAGPFTPQPTPIEGAHGIDPCVFIDRDGTAYLYYAARKIFVAKLKPNLLELDGPPQALANLPAKGLIEGPFVFERNGIYYLTYPHAANRTERLEYATGRSPLGPFTPAGVLMDESPDGCWTNHQSIVEFHGQWYLFYHDKDLSPDFDKARSVRADRLSFNADGTIQKVIPTLRGVGVVAATAEIQIDRYSATSEKDVTVSFLDSSNPHRGWKISLAAKNSWVRFDDVDFGRGALKSVRVRALAPTGGTIEIHADAADHPVLARVKIGRDAAWQTATAKVRHVPAGTHDLIVTRSGNDPVELDWLSFE